MQYFNQCKKHFSKRVLKTCLQKMLMDIDLIKLRIKKNLLTSFGRMFLTSSGKMFLTLFYVQSVHAVLHAA